MTETLTEKLAIMVGDESMEQEQENLDLTQEDVEILTKAESMTEEQLEAQEKQLEQELEGITEDLKKLNQEMQDELIESNVNFDTTNLLKSLQDMMDQYKGNPKYKHELAQMQSFVKELESCTDFDPILKSVKKIKNPKKIFDRYESDLDNMLNKLVKKFNTNVNYKFINPIRNNIVEKVNYLLGNEQDSKLFVYLFAGFAASQNRINSNAVFINEVLRQLKYVEKLPEDKQQVLKANILKVLDLMK